jgi:hypothetical protein
MKEEMTGARLLTGRCTCGAVVYEVSDEFEYTANCHCADRRRTTGSAFKPFAGIPRAKLSVTKGARELMIVGEAHAHDARCKKCGSLLYSLVRDGQYVHVTMGTLVDDPAIRSAEHIFVALKAPRFTIADDLPQHDGHVST